MPVDLPIDSPHTKNMERYPGFLLFWKHYPSKRAKPIAFRSWVREGCEPYADKIIADVEERRMKDDHWLRGYIPMPSTYINQHRWQDEITKPKLEPTSDNDWVQMGSDLGVTARPGEDWRTYIQRVKQAAH